MSTVAVAPAAGVAPALHWYVAPVAGVAVSVTGLPALVRQVTGPDALSVGAGENVSLMVKTLVAEAVQPFEPVTVTV